MKSLKECCLNLFHSCCPINVDDTASEDLDYDSYTEAFDYQDICKQDVNYVGADTEGQRWITTRDEENEYIYFMHEPHGNVSLLKRIREITTGWKFHISLSETDSNNIKNAWNNVILPMAITHKIHKLKIVTPKNHQNDKGNRQAGKQVTLYVTANPAYNAEKWETILTAITQSLAEYEIQPGPHAKVYAEITESNDEEEEQEAIEVSEESGEKQYKYVCDEKVVSAYISYRNDENEQGIYTTKPTGYKPEGIQDSYENISMTIDNEPQPEPHWEDSTPGLDHSPTQKSGA